jgi:aspartyl protease family protein
LRAQIQALVAAHGIQLEGANRIQDAPSRDTSGEFEARLRTLLDEHNFVIHRDVNGTITSVIVSGQRREAPEPVRHVSIKTVRRGSNHFVEAVVIGERSARTPVRLMLDTGASQVVLPKSMIEELGYAKAGNNDLRQAVLQTANGAVDGYIGTLRRIEVGQAAETDVEVAFIDDELLGGNKLLGMSFLGRYVVTLDDAAATLGLTMRHR